MEKTFDAATAESKWYRQWRELGCFSPDSSESGPPLLGRTGSEARGRYCITIPPPNVTGSLHMGHALCYTIQDILGRWRRMCGDNVLIQPGVDHGGISTQTVVEKEIDKEGLTRQDMGRDAFIERVNQWKDQYGARIVEQLQRLGCAFDWSRERYTMDAAYSDAVLEHFIRLYDQGLIYRGARVINWCPRCRTALSDIEVEHIERDTFLWHIRYPFADGNGSVTVATTRPETMIGDTAVAVNPDDPRYAGMQGRMLLLPLADREIPLIFDSYASMEFGTGAVKVTPAHDLNDYEAGRRHKLPQIVVIGEDGRMTAMAGDKYANLTREEAREAVERDLEAQGYLVEKEPYRHSVGICDRCKSIIEPLLSEQWFVKMAGTEMVDRAIEVARSGEVKFVPDRYTRIYLEWMENIRDWCISRQLWWGHRIPIYYAPDGSYAAAKSSEEAAKKLGLDRPLSPNSGGAGSPSMPIVGYQTPLLPNNGETDSPVSPNAGGPSHPFPILGGEGVVQASPELGNEGPLHLRQDEDVLDTWFSSDLWPFATLGWPAETPELSEFYPTNVLVTSREILYLWVARMIMMGIEFTGKIPFHEVYIYATVLDKQGRRMSKSLGNGIDPIEMIDRYGADALRFSLVRLASKGQDIRFSEDRIPEARNFCTKIWNAARFVEMNLGPLTPNTGGQTPLRHNNGGSDSHIHPSDERLDNPLPILGGEGVVQAPPELESGGQGFSIPERWILTRLQQTAAKLNATLASYDMDDACTALYEFFWNDYCDWFVELAKPALRSEDAQERRRMQWTLWHVLESALRLMHPIMPVLTEEIWQSLPHSGETIMRAEYPTPDESLIDEAATAQMDTIIAAIRAVRNARGELKIAPSLALDVVIVADGSSRALIAANQATLQSLARLNPPQFANTPPTGEGVVAIAVQPGLDLFLPLVGAVDTEKEKARLTAEKAAVDKDIAINRAKLDNPQFVAKAAPEVVAKAQTLLSELIEKKTKLEERLNGLGG